MRYIKRLREICQKERQGCDTAHGKIICRRVSIYITWIFLKMKITPNIATLIFLLSIIPPCLYFGAGSRTSVFIGVIFLQVWYILDHVDGEIARYRNLSSLTGKYFDNIVHYIAHPLVFLCLGYGLVRRLNMPYIFLFASSAAVSTTLINILQDLKKSVLFDANRSKGPSNKMESEQKNRLFARKIFSLLHKSCIFPNIMDGLTIAAILEIFLPFNFVLYLLVYFGILMPVVWVSKLAVIIMKKELDFA
ncbi:MAG: CDP-alcohol phosphatidyltransferase family protein [Candidatus Orphnella occulta]|nr:CDP-alcohol phosphatidyltransferase family protein [Candidatus Orphnella occulta]